MRHPAACMASAFLSSTPCRPIPLSKWPATSNYIANASRKAIRSVSWKSLAPPPTGAAPPLPSRLIPKFSARMRSSNPRACSSLPGQRLICSLALKFAGAAMRNSQAQMSLPKRCSNSPVACPTICANSLAPAPAQPRSFSLARKISPMRKAASNGRFHGRFIPTVRTAGIVTPFQRPMAAPMKRAFARR